MLQYMIFFIYIQEGHIKQHVVLKPNVRPHLKTKLSRSSSSAHRRNWIFWPRVTSSFFIYCYPDCSSTNHTHAASYNTTDTPAQDSHRQLDACSAVEMSVCHHYQSHNGESTIHYRGFMVLQLLCQCHKNLQELFYSTLCHPKSCLYWTLALAVPVSRSSHQSCFVNLDFNCPTETWQNHKSQSTTQRPHPKTSLNSLWNYC